ncbi:cupin domain-containing protein [Tistrella bauzanensis]|uniref:cupin domain-containing protein n=1 Tax=Tistrella TaxID=171436 RepID=UPI0031F6D840
MTATTQPTVPTHATEPPARVTIARADRASFAGDGLRAFFSYRDLDIGTATQGRFHAHVIRAEEAVTAGTGRHAHRLDFQMVYILKGWVRFWYDGTGVVDLRAGDCVYQPPGIAHELQAGSDDLEMLEITSPADFGTDPVAPPPATGR